MTWEGGEGEGKGEWEEGEAQSEQREGGRQMRDMLNKGWELARRISCMCTQKYSLAK